MPNPTFHEVERGPTFEIHQGAQVTQRLDWSGQALRSIYAGHATAECAATCIRRWEAALHSRQNINMFHDAWDMTEHESAFRTEITDWCKKNPSVFTGFHILHRSKVVGTMIGVLSLAVPGLKINQYAKRADFDVLARKAGLPLNPAMPPLTTRT